MAGIVIFGLIPLAMLFWLVEVIRAKLAGRPPSWKQPHEPVPKNSLGRALWTNFDPPRRVATPAATKRSTPNDTERTEP